LRASHRAGLAPSEFWKLTPYQLRLICEERSAVLRHAHQMRSWHAWHVAALQRAKKMPTLRQMIGGKAGMTEDELISQLSEYQRRRETGED